MSHNIKILNTEILNSNKSTKRNKTNNKKVFLTLVILLILSLLLVPREYYKSGIRKILAMAGIYTEEIKNVEITSNDYDDPGSFKVTKSAKWINTNTVQIAFDVDSIIKTEDNYKDIILVIDTSYSMDGDKFTKVITDLKRVINMVLNDDNNRVALIEFNSTSQVLSGFTNSKEIINDLLDDIVPSGNTNYNVGLRNIDTVMNNYIKQNNTDVVALFLTDGFPNEGRPNEVATYNYLKDKYSYLTINAIQYKMGTDIVTQVSSVSDNQFAADEDNLYDVLLQACINPIVFKSFIIEDYINTDYYSLNSSDDINVSIGEATIVEDSDEKKVIWDFGSSSYFTGLHKKMTINLTLNSSIPSNKVFYPTNTKEVITYNLDEEEDRVITSTDTPVLTNKYNVVYDTNTPSGCSLENPSRTEYLIYSSVSKSTNEINCSGYLFRGWKIDEEDDTDITHINEDLFIMPGHDVTVRAEWSNQSISKSINGVVNTHATLYKVIQEEASYGNLALEFNGTHQDSIDSSLSTEKIYHYSGSNEEKSTLINNKNNVIFAGQCFQMIRTTDTGGVKMIYNGEAENNQCLNTRGSHIGYASKTTQTLNGNYWYGTDYEYDNVNKKFLISGETEQVTWGDLTFEDLIGKYTCKSTSEDGTCSTLYLIKSYNSPTAGYVIPINSNSNYSQFGMLQFNSENSSLTYSGYKYGDVYNYSTLPSVYTQSFSETETLFSSISIGTSLIYWFSDSISYDANTGLYSMVNPYQLSSTDEYPNLVGKYTFRFGNSNHTNSSIYYIAGVEDTIIHYVKLENGETLSSYEPIVFGDSITDNGNGTFTINNTISVSLANWFTNSSSYNNMYTCNNSSNTCANPRYLLSTSGNNYTYINAGEKIMFGKGRSGTTLTNTLLVRKDEFIINSSNYSDYKYTCNSTSAVCTEVNLRMVNSISSSGYTYALNRYYGSSVTWNGTNYTLVDPIEIENYNNINNLSTHHYICINEGSKTCESVAYIYYYTGSGLMHYITLENGVLSVSTAIENMFTKNTTDSDLKFGVDAWYKHFILEYDFMVEDTIYCNDRTISNLAGWDPDGGKTNTNLIFKSTVPSSFKCPNEEDSFSVNNNVAKLDYKVGLMTFMEMNKFGNARSTGQNYRLLSPNLFRADNIVFNYSVYSNGIINGFNVNNVIGVRPAISLKPGTEYYTGDGSMANPYIVEIDE